MKIILTATSPSIDSNVDARFGRGAYLILADSETMEWQALSNPAVGAWGGAGSQAAQFVASQNVEAVVSGDFGPNAFNALMAAGIAMYVYGTNTTVKQAIEQFKAGQLVRVDGPTGPARHFRR